MLKNVKIGKRLIGAFIILCFFMGIIAWYGARGLSSIDNSYTNLVTKLAAPLGILINMSQLQSQMRLDIRDVLLAKSREKQREYIEDIQKSSRELDEMSQEYEKDIVTEDMRKLFSQFKSSKSDYDQVIKRITAFIEENKTAEIETSMTTGAKYANETSSLIDKMAEMKLKMATETSEDNGKEANNTVNALILASILILALAMTMGLLLTLSVTRPLREMTTIAQGLAQGNINQLVEHKSEDEIGLLAESFRQTLSYIQDVAKAADAIEAGNLNINLIPKSESDVLSRNFIRATETLRSMTKETQHLIAAAKSGKLAIRGDSSTYKGAYKEIICGVNEMLDAVVGPLHATADYVQRISRGDIPPKITDHYEGDFNNIKNNLNTCIDAVNALITDTNFLVTTAIEGKLRTRADATKHSGDFRRVIEGVNKTLDAVIHPVDAATAVLVELSNQNLRARVTGEYQGEHTKIKEAVNATGTALHNALVEVAEAVAQVAAASEQIASTSQSVSQGASEQAAALEETTSNLEEMSSTTKQNASSTSQANSLAQSAKSAADKGSAAMERMADAMAKIRHGAEGTAEIIRDINEIAFQTNLLALNAAVEAARAGDAGRGFAVVADEVRSLAQRAKEAAKKTEDLIKESVKLANDGASLSKEVAGDLSEIVNSVAKVNGIVAEIATASQEQARGIDQINKAVLQMDKVTQQSAGNAEESSSAAEELSGQAQSLASLVDRFKLERHQTTKFSRKSAHPRAPLALVAQARPEEVFPLSNDPELKEF